MVVNIERYNHECPALHKLQCAMLDYHLHFLVKTLPRPNYIAKIVKRFDDGRKKIVRDTGCLSILEMQYYDH
jgi:hypothetical protein